jgi:prephenate dehydrogenase
LSTLGEKAAVIGGSGGMGRWLAQFLKEAGFKVTITGRRPNKTEATAKELKVNFSHSYETLTAESDIVAVATPIAAMPQIITEAAQRMRRGALLLDIASVKEPITPALNQAKAKGINIISLHPMFGPDVGSLTGRNIIIIPLKADPKVTAAITNLFQQARAQTTTINTLKEHDCMIALTLALPHFLNITFGITLSSSGPNINELKKFAGTTFTLQLMLAEVVLQENPHLYSEIQLSNKTFHQLLETLTQRIGELKNIVKSGRKDEFEKIFNDARKHLSSDEEFDKARQKFINSLKATKLVS